MKIFFCLLLVFSSTYAHSQSGPFHALYFKQFDSVNTWGAHSWFALPFWNLQDQSLALQADVSNQTYQIGLGRIFGQEQDVNNTGLRGYFFINYSPNSVVFDVGVANKPLGKALVTQMPNQWYHSIYTQYFTSGDLNVLYQLGYPLFDQNLLLGPQLQYLNKPTSSLSLGLWLEQKIVSALSLKTSAQISISGASSFTALLQLQ